MLENFEFVELSIPKERPIRKHIDVKIHFTFVETLEEWENALIGVNPRTEMCLMTVVNDQKTFKPLALYHMFRKELYYAVPTEIVDESETGYVKTSNK